MPYDHLGYIGNSPSDPAPWSIVENARLDDIETSLHYDCTPATNENTIYGHRHFRIYDGAENLVFRADNEDRDVVIGLAEDDPSTVVDSTVTVCIGASSPSHFKVIDNAGRQICSFNDSISSIGGSEYVLFGGTEYTKFIEMRVVDGGDTATIQFSSGSSTLFRADCRTGYENTLINCKGVTNALQIDSDGKVFTRDVFDVEHLIYGLSEVTTDVVELVMIGGASFLHISIDGTKSGSDMFISLPFGSGFTLAEGEKIAAGTGHNAATEVVVSVQYWENLIINGCDLHLVPIGGTPESSGWTNEDRCAVSMIIPFLVATPEFVNEIPV
jgi:hypothetical protein